ncbi:TPA: MliC family protein [Pasteurella multocida]|nr:MliC family protein [Pasteurella multocida]HDX1179887.1 MliC family protein [Pasteurella multocida]HDX1192688.1 MliC family protein [Pasteurella multocida]HDX1193826.1 MliC family protein [Pasteurella multocida]
MHIIKTLISVSVVFSLSACLSLEGVEIAGLEGKSSGTLTKYRCENGYKASIKQRDNGVVSIAFNDGKDSYVSYLHPMSSGSDTLYVNDKNTLKWHQKNNIAVFTYPDRHYAKTGQLVTTNCHKY